MKSEMFGTMSVWVFLDIYSCSEFAFLMPLDRIDHNLTIHRSHTTSAAARRAVFRSNFGNILPGWREFGRVRHRRVEEQSGATLARAFHIEQNNPFILEEI